MVIAFIDGIIFGDSIKQSILEFSMVLESLLIVYFFIAFAFNPWKNASYIPPNSIQNLYTLFVVMIIFSVLGIVAVLIISLLIYEFATFGTTIRFSDHKPIGDEEINSKD